IYYQLLGCGADYITMGNHTFSKSELKMFIQEADRLIRPVNLAPVELGEGVRIARVNGKRIGMVNLCGEVFMDNVVRSPFECMSEILNRTLADLWFVDFHGETTGEKETFAQVFADRCVMIVGTHTHVQTADEQLMRGCAYISDAGMCGAFDSILGRDKREVIERTLYQIKTRYTVAEGPAMLCGVWAEIDEITGRATRIERIQIRP
ncbi:TIGR00282 family metallophosphoesterase, partial [Holdemania filiformis]